LGFYTSNKFNITLINIAIIGSGQIGTCHLLGLAKAAKPINIFVVDPDENKFSITKERYQNTVNLLIHNVSYCIKISDIPTIIDLAIIATTANIRRKVTEQLLDICSIKYLIFEKIVFQEPKDFKIIHTLLNNKGIKCWVNCPRRSFPVYKRIKSKVNSGLVSIRVIGKNWGLGCNAIHMIDLFMYLTGENDINVNTDELKNIVIDSKRLGYKELSGTLKIQTGRGDTLILIDEENLEENITISITNSGNEYHIYESVGKIKTININNNTQEEKIKIPLQSELTYKIVDQILNTGNSDLTDYQECMQYHIPMLNGFIEHFSKVTNQQLIACPIT